MALERAVALAREEGRLPDDTDARQLAFELHAVLTAGNQRFRLTRDPAVFAHARSALARLLQRAA
jgi:hypothetical protein